MRKVDLQKGKVESYGVKVELEKDISTLKSESRTTAPKVETQTPKVEPFVEKENHTTKC